MAEYEVTQMLVRERVVRVEAGTKEQAIQRAKDGWGVVVSNPRAPLRLLSASAQRVVAESRTRPSREA